MDSQFGNDQVVTIAGGRQTTTPMPRGCDPLDFSFKCLCSLNDLQEEVPRTREGKGTRTRQIVERVARASGNLITDDKDKENEEENSEGQHENEFEKFKRKESLLEGEEEVTRDVYVATAIRLNNNTLSDLAQLQPIMTKILVNWEWLAWIDLSFNDISTLDISIGLFPELRMLYLHGNAIEKISEVDKLKSVEHLHTLTLHGNPIEMAGSYRFQVLAKLPYLKTLDFSAVTNQEKNLSTRQKFSKKKA